MNQDFMWGYFLHLSRHFLDDASSIPRGLYLDPNWTEGIDTDLETWDEVIHALPQFGINTVLIDVLDGIQYESHPEISAPDAWSKDFLKKKLDEIRALGMEPIPKLNFSACHDIWLKDYSRMLCTPIYYQVCADVIREVCEVFDHPRLFHLGMDEEDVYQDYYDMHIARHEELWWHDLMFLFNEVEKNGARPWIWTRYTLIRYEERFLKQMPKSVLQTLVNNGKYHGLDNLTPPALRKATEDQLRRIDLLNDHGYDMVLTGNFWSYYRNIHQTVALGKNRVDPTLHKGFLIAPWMPTRKEERYALLSNAEKLYYARKRFYPETL